MGTTKIRRGYRIEEDVDIKFGEKVKAEGTDRSSRVRELIKEDIKSGLNIKCVVSVSQETSEYMHKLLETLNKDIWKYISKIKNISKNNVHVYVKDKTFIGLLKINEKKYKIVNQSEKTKDKNSN